jgi:hypothetical protein
MPQYPVSPLRPAIPLLANAGILAPLIFAGGVIVAGWLRPGYDPRHHGISDLARGPFGWLQTANFLVTGLLLLGFTLGLRRALPPSRAARLAGLLLVLGGVGLLLLGLCPRDLAGETPTWRGAIHNIAGNSLLSLPLAGLALAPAVRHDPIWRPTLALSVGIGLLTLLLLPGYVSALRGGALHPWSGLIQRLLVLGPLCWVEALAIRLRRVTVGPRGR